MTNNPEASIIGTVTNALKRFASCRFRVQWDTGRYEWVRAGDIKEAK